MAESESVQKVPAVGRVQGVQLELCDPMADTKYHLQYTDPSGQRFEITVPIREAFRLMDLLKESKDELNL